MRHKILLAGQQWIESGKLAWILAPFSWIWALTAFCKNMFYDTGLLKAYPCGKTVVSIGNIVAGGTGKTPLVLFLASRFSHRKIAILSRGYGVFPDEAMLLARRLPNAKVYIGKDRVSLAKKAVQDGAELLILDDGFQHRRLHRDFELVLLDGQDPLGKGHYLPWGFLRDSPKRLIQADAIFMQKNHFAYRAIQFHVEVKKIINVQGEPLSSIQGWTVGLFCGIAKPKSFKKTVESLGAIVKSEWVLADHEPARLASLQKFAVDCKELGAKALICTEKDFIKLPKQIAVDLPIYFLEMGLRIDDARWENLIVKIDRKIDNCSTL